MASAMDPGAVRATALVLVVFIVLLVVCACVLLTWHVELAAAVSLLGAGLTLLTGALLLSLPHISRQSALLVIGAMAGHILLTMAHWVYSVVHGRQPRTDEPESQFDAAAREAAARRPRVDTPFVRKFGGMIPGHG